MLGASYTAQPGQLNHLKPLKSSDILDVFLTHSGLILNLCPYARAPKSLNCPLFFDSFCSALFLNPCILCLWLTD
jgi:hypothetical protein